MAQFIEISVVGCSGLVSRQGGMTQGITEKKFSWRGDRKHRPREKGGDRYLQAVLQ